MDEALALRVREIVAENARKDVSDVKLESTLEDLGIDSLTVVDIIFQLEEEYDVSIPFNSNNPADSEFQMANIGDVVRSMQTLIAS